MSQAIAYMPQQSPQSVVAEYMIRLVDHAFQGAAVAELGLNVNVTPLVPGREVRDQVRMSPERRVRVHLLSDQILWAPVHRLFDLFNRIRYPVEQICALVYDPKTTCGDELVNPELFVEAGRLQFAYADVGHLAAVHQMFDDGRMDGNRRFVVGRRALSGAVVTVLVNGDAEVVVVRPGDAFLSVFQ